MPTKASPPPPPSSPPPSPPKPPSNPPPPPPPRSPPPLAHDLAHRLLWHSLLVKTAIAAALCLITTLTALLAFHTTAPTNAAAPTSPATQPADERLIHLGKILEPSSDKLVAEILAGIEQNRPKLKTLEIESTATFSEQIGDDPTFQNAEITGKGWFQTGNPQRFRVEISLERSPWTNGAKPYLDDSYTETWDGAILHVLHQPPHSSLRADVGEHEGYADGVAVFNRGSSMQLVQDIGWGAGDQEFKQDPLDTRVLKSQRLSARRVILNGVETLELEVRLRLSDSFKGPNRADAERYARRYWLDPARGFALLACQKGLDGTPPMDEEVIDELAQPAPGIFYPARSRYIGYSRDHNPEGWHLSLRSEFHATRITANQPLAPSLFHLDFPPGISITDLGPSASSQPASQPATQP